MNLLDVFSKRLVELREELGDEYPRQRVANDLGITRASLEYYEKGMRMPDIEKLNMLADYYNVSADYLLGRTDVRCTDRSLHSVSEAAGITEKAAENLCELGKKYVSVSMFLEDENADELFKMLNEVIMSKFSYRYFNSVIRNRLANDLGKITDKAGRGIYGIEFTNEDVGGYSCYHALQAMLSPLSRVFCYDRIYNELEETAKLKKYGVKEYDTNYNLPDISEHNSVCEYSAWKTYMALIERILNTDSHDKALTESFEAEVVDYITNEIKSNREKLTHNQNSPENMPAKVLVKEGNPLAEMMIAYYKQLLRDWFDIYDE